MDASGEGDAGRARRWTGGQIAALIFALLLLLPGGCFLFVGVAMTFDPHPDAIEQSIGPLALVVGLGVLSLMGLLFWLAFRRRKSADAPEPSANPKP